MMKNALIAITILAAITLPALAFAGGWGGFWTTGGHEVSGGGGVPEPLTLALIAAGGGLAIGARKLLKRK